MAEVLRATEAAAEATAAVDPLLTAAAAAAVAVADMAAAEEATAEVVASEVRLVPTPSTRPPGRR